MAGSPIGNERQNLSKLRGWRGLSTLGFLIDIPRDFVVILTLALAFLAAVLYMSYNSLYACYPPSEAGFRSRVAYDLANKSFFSSLAWDLPIDPADILANGEWIEIPRNGWTETVFGDSIYGVGVAVEISLKYRGEQLWLYIDDCSKVTEILH